MIQFHTHRFDVPEMLLYFRSQVESRVLLCSLRDYVQVR